MLTAAAIVVTSTVKAGSGWIYVGHDIDQGPHYVKRLGGKYPYKYFLLKGPNGVNSKMQANCNTWQLRYIYSSGTKGHWQDFVSRSAGEASLTVICR